MQQQAGKRDSFLFQTRLTLLILGFLLAGIWSTGRGRDTASADSTIPSPPKSVTLYAVADASVQSNQPTTNYAAVPLAVTSLTQAYILFDLSALRTGITIDAATLRLKPADIVGQGPHDIHIAYIDTVWDEATVTWTTKPSTTRLTVQTPVNDDNWQEWDLTPLVERWYRESVANYGLALGTHTSGVYFHSRETGAPPELVITYSVIDESDDPDNPNARPYPDLGDAPDSTNSFGLANSAYPGINGDFPTVWSSTSAGQPAGPRHANKSGEGYLGDALSRENEADSGPDQDGKNNILNGAGDNANNDRGDDGWRNRNAPFDNCQPTTLLIRVSKRPTAQLNRMYLNVWFDGNRDGDWADQTGCAQDGGFTQPGYEWIVQDMVIDMTSIPAGGHVDVPVTTELVMNSDPSLSHWMRFVLSEERAVRSTSDPADGRGPHPNAPLLKTYAFGETEDVIQRPQPRGEVGELVLEKQVLTDATPVAYGDTVTYQITLRHEGGSQPVRAQLRDELPYPLHLLRQDPDEGDAAYIDVTGTPGAVTPLRANLSYTGDNPLARPNQVVEWSGALAPNAEVVLTFNVHVHPTCLAGEEVKTIRNVAQARAQQGDPLQDVAELTVACPGYSVEDVVVTRALVDDEGSVMASSLDETATAQISLNFERVRVRTTLKNLSSAPLTVGATLGWTGCLTCTLAANATEGQRSAESVLLKLEAGETQSFDSLITVDQLLAGAQFDLDQTDAQILGEMSYCLLNDIEEKCPDAAIAPADVMQAPPLHIRIERRDLGDAPDSTNHPGAKMTAYPGVQANFPTVSDLASGAPGGPAHRHPHAFHLGQLVSVEAEADRGPDQDATNNILPAASTPDRDRGDDGVNVNQWALNHCQRTNLDVRVLISPQAAQWFQQKGKKGFINIWVDSNRDGDWTDGFTCQNSAGQAEDAVEQIVIDAPVDVVSLGAGIHTISVPTGLIFWPADDAQKAAWVRVTLSEREANKPLQSGRIKHGDGRGNSQPFQTGETEDYLLHPAGSQGDGPDVEVSLRGQARLGIRDGETLQTADVAKLGNFEIQDFKIDYANLGTQTAKGALLEFQIPEKLRDGEINLLRAPGVPTNNINMAHDKLTFTLPDLAAGDRGSIILNWTGCLTCTVAVADLGTQAPNVNRATATVTLAGDVNGDNNSATYEWTPGPLLFPHIYIKTAAGPHRNDLAVTCQDQVTIGGRGFQPGSDLTILRDGSAQGDVRVQADGSFEFRLELSDGRHAIAVQAKAMQTHAAALNQEYSGNMLWVLKESALLVDPMSLTFTDANGRKMQPPNTMSPPYIAEFKLPAAGDYEMTMYSCRNAAVDVVNLVLGSDFVPASADDACTPKGSDACGPWRAQITVGDEVQASDLHTDQSLQLIVKAGTMETTFESTVSVATAGVVRNASTDQPLSAASVTLLEAVTDDTQTVYNLWDGSASGQSNPQTTNSSGAYSATVPSGTYRVAVTRPGYQPYVSDDVVAAAGTVERDIPLTQVVTDEPTYVIQITETGFASSLIMVRPGSVIEFVNVDLTDHATISNDWDSGVLSAGESYKIRLEAEGTYAYSDSTMNTGSIIVDVNAPDPDTEPTEDHALFLPFVQRR